jgi:protein-disulfide isomerase
VNRCTAGLLLAVAFGVAPITFPGKTGAAEPQPAQSGAKPAGPPRATGLKVAIRPDDPVRGSSGAPVTVIEFSEFDSAFCRQGDAALREIEASHPGVVRVVWKHLPLSLHWRSRPAALAAEAARQQGQFWPMHDRLFAAPQAPHPDDLEALAAALGLDLSRYRAAVASPETADRIQEDRVEAGAARVTGTPAFVVNGELVIGWSGLRGAVERALQSTRSVK